MRIRGSPSTIILSLHDALPIFGERGRIDGHDIGFESKVDDAVDVLAGVDAHQRETAVDADLLEDGHAPLLDEDVAGGREADRKSTRLNSSHLVISYAVFCMQKK